MAETEKLTAANRRTLAESGFTMIEMLVSIMILSVIMAAVFSFLWGASRYWQSGQDTADVTENARMGLNRMTRELKQSSQVTGATSSQISFNVDFGSGAESVTYGFTPGTDGPGYVWRTSNSGPQVVQINEVSNAQFVYYGNDYRCDSDGNGVVTWTELQACGTGPESKISRVDIVLTMQAGNEPEQTFVGQAWLRNRNTVGGA